MIKVFILTFIMSIERQDKKKSKKCRGKKDSIIFIIVIDIT